MYTRYRPEVRSDRPASSCASAFVVDRIREGIRLIGQKLTAQEAQTLLKKTDEKTLELIGKLEAEHGLTKNEYVYLIQHMCEEAAVLLAEKARRVREKIYGKDVFVRGIIEFSNVCKNDCYYCGIRKDNEKVKRYRLTDEQIMECCRIGYESGYRTFVLQSGEDGYYTDEVLGRLVSAIRGTYPDCAITLSVGERSRESYQNLFEAGADRYLLRHETADEAHYGMLHPSEMSWKHRMNCLQELRDIGYDVGAGMMVGSPYQTAEDLAEDLLFIGSFKPEMCGIGPFIPHRDTPFRDEAAGTLEQTLYLLSIIRLIHPHVLLPSTTALGTIDPLGREKGVLAGANVVMPNLSPGKTRRQYELYNDKICMDDDAVQCRSCMDLRMRSIGYQLVVDRGDYRK